MTTVVAAAPAGLAQIDAKPPTSVATCHTAISETYRIVALGGLFPVPNYLAIDPLPGDHNRSLYFTLTKGRERQMDEEGPAISFGNGYFGPDLLPIPQGLNYTRASDMVTCSRGLQVQYFELTDDRVVNGVRVNSAAVVRSSTTRLDLYGRDVRCVVEHLLEAFTDGKSRCGIVDE